MTSETGDGLCRKLFDGPFRSRGSAVVEEGIARQVGIQSKKFTFDFNGVIKERSNSNMSRGIRRAFTRNREQGRDVDASLEIGYARSDLRNDRTSVTMGDENIRSDSVCQRSDSGGVFGEAGCRAGAVPRARKVDGPPRDATAIQFNADVAPTPRATPRAVHEDVRGRTHCAIFHDEGSRRQFPRMSRWRGLLTLRKSRRSGKTAGSMTARTRSTTMIGASVITRCACTRTRRARPTRDTYGSTPSGTSTFATGPCSERPCSHPSGSTPLACRPRTPPSRPARTLESSPRRALLNL